jgi:Lanthionine-containing peptide SapB precursor RamS
MEIMALLDLQGMEGAPQDGGGHGSSNSGKSCPSNLSLTLCGGGSGLSALICH